MCITKDKPSTFMQMKRPWAFFGAGEEWNSHCMDCFFVWLKVMNTTLILVKESSRKPARTASKNIRFPLDVIRLARFWLCIKYVEPTEQKSHYVKFIVQNIINSLTGYSNSSVYFDGGSFRTLGSWIIFQTLSSPAAHFCNVNESVASSPNLATTSAWMSLEAKPFSACIW